MTRRGRVCWVPPSTPGRSTRLLILSDFARLQPNTEAQEPAGRDERGTPMFAGSKGKALRDNDTEHRDERKTQCGPALPRAGEELEAARMALSAGVA